MMNEMCQVALCSSIKIKLKQQKALNSQAERGRILKMNKSLRQSAMFLIRHQQMTKKLSHLDSILQAKQK